MLRLTISLLTLILPWPLRRICLQLLLGFRLAPSARIGLALVVPRQLTMAAGASIGHFTVCKGMDLIALGEGAIVGRLNWISGVSTVESGDFYRDQRDRRSELVMGAHSAITSRHIIDCTDSVRIGEFATVAGYRTQLLTHSINVEESRQRSQAITIGRFTFVGTGCVILGGAALPDFSVLGALSLLNRPQQETYTLYAGLPARPVKELSRDLAYFHRSSGRVL